MKYPNSLAELIESFKMLPGIGEKTAERYALSILEMDNDNVNFFKKSISDVKQKIKRCSICNNLTELKICDICNSNVRNKKIICVVEEVKNIISFEKTGTYNGLYHVLNGLISPLDGINPDDINIKTLLDRVKLNEIEEIIIAVRPCIEGETTALYITKKLENFKVKISKIAYGIPLGADMGYIDPLTLEISFENRKQIS